MNKQSWRLQIEKMLGAKLIGLARRMKRVRKQQQAGGLVRLLGAEHACLPSTVRVATKINASGCQTPNGCNYIPQSRAIAFRFPRPRRTKGTVLTEWKIAAQHAESRASKGFRERN